MSPETEPQLKFAITPISPDDIEAATQMRFEVWLDTYINDDIGITSKWIEEYYRAQMTPEKNLIRKEQLKDYEHHAGWVAKDSAGNIIGSTAPFRHKDGRQEVGSLYVKKEWHGKGVAASLMQKNLDWFDLTQPIELGVVTYNERAKAFYRKWGFSEIPDSETLFANKIPEIKMIREGETK